MVLKREKGILAWLVPFLFLQAVNSSQLLLGCLVFTHLSTLHGSYFSSIEASSAQEMTES